MLIYVTHVYHGFRQFGDQFKRAIGKITDVRGTRKNPALFTQLPLVRVLDPKRPVEGPVLDGLADVLGGNAV
jgi:hypothetical protein